MPTRTLIKPSEYHDSVSLMLVARDLALLPGVEDAAVIMATEANKGILAGAGLLTTEAEAASVNDLVIAVRGALGVLDGALDQAEKLLSRKNIQSQSGEVRPKTLRGALKSNPEANLVVISVAGRYASAEAWEALRNGLHVLLFSDNVSIDDEIALKRYAAQQGLLLMGPGAGTAIINGVALGFANVLPRGPVGIVSAAGTGLQEVSTLLAREGVGITQGIGTGGRDLKEEIGGIMMLAGLKALQADPETRVIVLVSKPPAASVMEDVLDQVAQNEKPAVVCFLGGDPDLVRAVRNALPARTLQEAALTAARQAGAVLPEPGVFWADENRQLMALAGKLRERLNPDQHYLRALYSGGTLCYEAQVIWQDLLENEVLSNAPLRSSHRLPDSNRSQGHTAVDLGEEEFTVGRPHPMIDNDLRIRRIFQEASDPQVGVIVLDVVLGYGAHPDPASELAPAIYKARGMAQGGQAQGGQAQGGQAQGLPLRGRQLVFIASVTGTEEDPQRLSRQIRALESEGITICQSNAAAARLAAFVLSPELNPAN